MTSSSSLITTSSSSTSSSSSCSPPSSEASNSQGNRINESSSSESNGRIIMIPDSSFQNLISNESSLINSSISRNGDQLADSFMLMKVGTFRTRPPPPLLFNSETRAALVTTNDIGNRGMAKTYRSSLYSNCNCSGTNNNNDNSSRKKRLSIVKPSKLNVSPPSNTSSIKNSKRLLKEGLKSTMSNMPSAPPTTINEENITSPPSLLSGNMSSKEKHNKKPEEELLKQVFGSQPLVQDFSTFCKRLDTISLKDDNSTAESSEHHYSSSFTTMQNNSIPTSSNDNGSIGAPPTAKKSKRSTCAAQARKELDISVDDLAEFLEDSVTFPKKMSYMAEMMYT